LTSPKNSPMLPYRLMTIFHAEYQGLALWVQGEANQWKQHVHEPAIDTAGQTVFGSPFAAAPSATTYGSEAEAKKAACAEATSRKHPDGEVGCEEAGIVWKEIAETE
jgi:hypothetical protein